MNLGLPEIILIFAIIFLLFGAKKLPEVAKSMGRALREFKKEVKDIAEEADTHSQDPKKNDRTDE